MRVSPRLMPSANTAVRRACLFLGGAPALDVPGKGEVVPTEEVQVLVDERRESPGIGVRNCVSIGPAACSVPHPCSACSRARSH